MLGECVISSVLSHHSKNLKWQTSVTVLLQFSFIQQAKDSTSSTSRSRRIASICALLIMPKPLTVWITTNCGKFFKR